MTCMTTPDRERPPVYDPFVWSNVPRERRMGEGGWRTVFGDLAESWLPIGRAIVAALAAKGVDASLGDSMGTKGAEIDLSLHDLQALDWFDLSVTIVGDRHDRGLPVAVRVVGCNRRSPYRGTFKPSAGAANWLRPAEAAAAKVAGLLEATRRGIAAQAENRKRETEVAAEHERLRHEELGGLEPPEGFAFRRVGNRLWAVHADGAFGFMTNLGAFSPEDVKALVALLEKGRRR